jgi:hypothetical protein
MLDGFRQTRNGEVNSVLLHRSSGNLSPQTSQNSTRGIGHGGLPLALCQRLERRDPNQLIHRGQSAVKLSA